MQIQNKMLFFVYTVFAAALLSSCVSTIDGTGKKALEQFAVKADASTEDRSGVWETKDVFIEYTITPSGSTFLPSGTITIKDSILNSFSAADFFTLNINYLGSDGIVISSHGISPLLGTNIVIQGKYKLNHIPVAPPGSVSFTFSYWGNFSSRDLSDQSSDWEVFFKPFE